MDEEKQKEQIMKKQENKKTLKNSQVIIEDALYQMINKPKYVRKIIFSAFDKLNLQDFDKWRYKTGCCSKCILEGGHAVNIDTARKVKAIAPRPKAKRFQRLAIIENLEKWQDCVELIKFQGSQLILNSQCKFFILKSIMKSIS